MMKSTPVRGTTSANVSTTHTGTTQSAARSARFRTYMSKNNKNSVDVSQHIAAGAASLALLLSSPAFAESNVRLPPLDTDPNRCERAATGNTIGQANAVSDRILDLRFCDFSGKDLSAKTLSGALLSDAILKGTNLQEAVMSKAYAVGANFSGADMTNAIVDRVVFDKADLSGVQFVNAVITGATFDGANLDGANFEDALIGSEDAKRLCNNPTVTGETRGQIGCRGK